MSIDVVGNFLTIIRNGLMRSKPFVLTSHSKMLYAVAEVFLNEGFIKEITVIEDNPIKKKIKITLKYVDNESVIHEIKRVSKPGRRFYEQSTKLKPVIGNLGISILTTSKGIMTNKRAKELCVGGEVLCTVW